MWKVLHIETCSTYKILTLDEPPVELRTNDVNVNAKRVVGQIALVPEMIAMLRILNATVSPFARHRATLDDLIAKLDDLEARDAPPR